MKTYLTTTLSRHMIRVLQSCGMLPFPACFPRSSDASCRYGPGQQILLLLLYRRYGPTQQTSTRERQGALSEDEIFLLQHGLATEKGWSHAAERAS